MRKKLTPILLFAPLLFVASCGPRLLFPQRANVAMLSERGEVKITAAVKAQTSPLQGHSGFSPSIEGAGAVSNHIAVIASYYRQNKYADDADYYDKPVPVDDSLQYTGKNTEFGGGYYTHISHTGIVELLGGVENGVYYRHNLADASRDFKLKFTGFFLQPSIGWNFNDKIILNLGYKFTLRKYRDFISPTDDLRFSFTGYTDVTTLYPLLVQSYFNISFGYKYGYFNIQSGYYGVRSSPEINNISPFYLSAGASFCFAPRLKRGNKK